MAINVKLPEALVETAKRYGAIERRSVPKQIEHWTQIGRIALFWLHRPRWQVEYAICWIFDDSTEIAEVRNKLKSDHKNAPEGAYSFW